jgi:hypothetical protein
VKRVLSSLLSLVFAASLSSVVFAQNPAPMASHPASMASPAVKKCPEGQRWVKGYKNSSGTWVKGYCRNMPAPAASKAPCPSGQTWVNGYTKADGTVVKGYCRSGASSSGNGMSAGSPAPMHT